MLSARQLAAAAAQWAAALRQAAAALARSLANAVRAFKRLVLREYAALEGVLCNAVVGGLELSWALRTFAYFVAVPVVATIAAIQLDHWGLWIVALVAWAFLVGLFVSMRRYVDTATDAEVFSERVRHALTKGVQGALRVLIFLVSAALTLRFLVPVFAAGFHDLSGRTMRSPTTSNAGGGPSARSTVSESDSARVLEPEPTSLSVPPAVPTATPVPLPTSAPADTPPSLSNAVPTAALPPPSEPPPPSAVADSNHPTVVITTSMGAFKAELYPDKAPATVRNFLRYVDDHFYDGTLFHRVMTAFVIQGGGYDRAFAKKPTRAPIVNESWNGLTNDAGTLAMARTNVADSATSQFFVNVVDNAVLNPSGSSDGVGYAVFGRVVEGMDVVHAIRAVPTGRRFGLQDVPNAPVVIESIRVINVPTRPRPGPTSGASPAQTDESWRPDHLPPSTCSETNTGNFGFANTKAVTVFTVRVYFREGSDSSRSISVPPGQTQYFYDFPAGRHNYVVTYRAQVPIMSFPPGAPTTEKDVIYLRGEILVKQCRSGIMEIR